MLRKAKNNELDKILQIINEGKQFLKEQGIKSMATWCTRY